MFEGYSPPEEVVWLIIKCRLIEAGHDPRDIEQWGFDVFGKLMAYWDGRNKAQKAKHPPKKDKPKGK